MAINKNHEFEDLDGVKCAIVERNVAPARLLFLRQLLEYNGFTVVVIPTPPPKPAKATEAATPSEPSILPETFTAGVTDVTFNATNAVFGRLLKTPGGRTVTLAYWKQEEKEPHDEVPYFEKHSG